MAELKVSDVKIAELHRGDLVQWGDQAAMFERYEPHPESKSLSVVYLTLDAGWGMPLSVTLGATRTLEHLGRIPDHAQGERLGAWGEEGPVEAVRKGIAWLASIKPAWHRQVDFDLLDMSSGCHCVLGQNFAEEARRAETNPYGHYSGFQWAVDNMLPTRAGTEGESFGFTIGTHSAFNFRELDILWRLAILDAMDAEEVSAA